MCIDTLTKNLRHKTIVLWFLRFFDDAGSQFISRLYGFSAFFDVVES